MRPSELLLHCAIIHSSESAKIRTHRPGKSIFMIIMVFLMVFMSSCMVPGPGHGHQGGGQKHAGHPGHGAPKH